MIIQKNRRVNFESKFNTFCNEIPSRKHLSTSIKYSRSWKKYNSILCVAGKELNFSRRVSCELYEPKKSHTRLKSNFDHLLIIFFITQIHSPFCICKREGSSVKPSKEKFWEKSFEKNVEKKFGKKNLKEKFYEKNFGKKFCKKKFRKKVLTNKNIYHQTL